MSFIFGIQAFIEKDLFICIQQMKQDVNALPFDQASEWVVSNIALGNCLRRNTPESAWECVPLTLGAVTITCQSRIDNRSELFKQLTTYTAAEQVSIPDSVLLLKAYEKWGADMVQHLEGDWCLAIWDAANQELLVARDAFGSTALYYQYNPEFFAFSNSIKPLLGLNKENLHINELFMAGVLTVWDAKNCETAFKDILVLPPAHAIRIKNGIKQIIRYWVMEYTPPLYLKSAKDYIEPYLFHIRQSVENRMRSIGPVATQLSSGFDSSTVTAFAAQKYMREGKRLTTFTSVPFYDSGTLFPNRIATDESYLTIPTCKFLGNADNYIVSSQHTSILNSLLLSLEMHNVPLHAAGNMYWIYDIYELAHQQGIRTLLNGQLGNATISWSGYSVYNELKKWIRQTLLLQHPQWKERAKLANLVLSKRQWPDSDALPNPWDSYSVISQQFGKDIQLKDQMRQTGHDPYFTSNFHFKQIRLQFLNPTQSRAGMIWQNIGHHYGIDTFDPTNDRRLTAFCWSVPNNIYFREGEYKWLIKHAMQGILPDSLIHQTRKGRQATDISFRIQKEGVAFQDLLDSFKKEAAIGYYLDIPKMEQLLNEIRLRPDQVSAYGNSIFLLRGIQTGLFIRKYIN